MILRMTLYKKSVQHQNVKKKKEKNTISTKYIENKLKNNVVYYYNKILLLSLLL